MGLTEKIIIHFLSGLKTSLGIYRGKGGQQGAVKYSIQSSKWKPTTCAKTHKLRNSKKHFKQSPIGCKRLMRLRSAANNQAARRNEIIKGHLQLGSSSNRYAPRLPQQETKSSTKKLAPTDPILGPENLLKIGFAQKDLPGRSSRFGDGLCMEKYRVSYICYLSKKHFVRDFLQNSIGNSSTSTTCNAICIAGTILQLQSTMEFHRQLIHQHHLQSHLHCGNDPTVINHNGILSTAHA